LYSHISWTTIRRVDRLFGLLPGAGPGALGGLLLAWLTGAEAWVPLLVGLGTVVGGLGKLAYDHHEAEQKRKLEPLMDEVAAWQRWLQGQPASSAEEVATELARIAPEAVENVGGGMVFAKGRRAEIQRCADALSAAGFDVPPWVKRSPTLLWCEVHGRNCLVILGFDPRESS
jgi:hypothetical protein